MPAQRVALLGLGLIGASFGLALKATSPSLTLVGFDPNGETARRVKNSGAIDQRVDSAAEAVQNADLVILAAPVRAILELLDEIGPHLVPGVLVTDTGSTKALIVERAEAALPAGAAFVGGHPMTGRLSAGVSGPDPALYRNAVYCLTPTSSTPPEALERATGLVESIGARLRFLDPGEHDALLAGISHLPYFTAAALVAAVTSQSAWADMSGLAAGGFRTVTSLVEASDEMWTDVALSNREPLLRQMDELIETLTGIRALVADGRGDELATLLGKAHKVRQEWTANQPGGAQAMPAPSPRRFPFFR